MNRGGGGVGEVLVLRIVQQDGYTNPVTGEVNVGGGVWHWACFDNVRVSLPGGGEQWDKVAKLAWTDPADAAWDFLFTPDRGYAVDLNSFDLDPLGAAGNESGTWTVYQDDEDGAVIDSGSWTNLAADSTVTVDMSSVGGSYAGPVLLRLTITAGDAGQMAVDNIDYDQIALACDRGYQLAWDLDSDCFIGLSDFALFAAQWMNCNDPTDLDCSPSWP